MSVGEGEEDSKRREIEIVFETAAKCGCRSDFFVFYNTKHIFFFWSTSIKAHSLNLSLSYVRFSELSIQ